MASSDPEPVSPWWERTSIGDHLRRVQRARGVPVSSQGPERVTDIADFGDPEDTQFSSPGTPGRRRITQRHHQALRSSSGLPLTPRVTPLVTPPAPQSFVTPPPHPPPFGGPPAFPFLNTPFALPVRSPPINLNPDENLSDTSTLAAGSQRESDQENHVSVVSNRSQSSGFDPIPGQEFRNVPVQIPGNIPEDMVDLSHQFQPPRLSGEEGTLTLGDFISALELSFPALDRQFPNPQQNQRAKGLTLQSYLDGPARQFWFSLRANVRASYTDTIAALKLQFPDEAEEDVESAKDQAILEMTNLNQGSMSIMEYERKANQLYARLGEDYSRILATKFVRGIREAGLKTLVDSQFPERRYTFAEALTAFRRCTRIDRQGEVLKLKSEARENPPDTMIPVYQVAELIKTLNLNPQAAAPAVPSGGNRYQPIVGTVGYTPPSTYPSTQQPQGQPPAQSQGMHSTSRYGMYTNQAWRPRNDFVCFTCGQPGHRSFDCTSPNPLPREEQERLRTARLRMQPPGAISTNQAGSNIAESSHSRVPQAVACVEVTDEELGLIQDTSPNGTVVMSAKLVELVRGETKQPDQMAKLRAYLDSLSEGERACLVAMAEKRGRAQIEDDDELAEEAPRAQKARVNPNVQSYPPKRIILHTQPRKKVPEVEQPEQGQVVPISSPEDPIIIPEPESQPFIPDPFFENPANWDPEFMPPVFTPAAVAPKSRKKRNAGPKIRRHIKIMKGKKEWDPIEALRNLPVTGLDFGNLLDWSPGIRIAMGQALQLDGVPPKKKKNVQHKVPDPDVMEIAYAVQEVDSRRSREEGSSKISVLAHRGKLKGVRDIEVVKDGVLQEPRMRIFNFHTTGEVWPAGKTGGTGYRIGKILLDGGAVVNLMPETTARKLGLSLLNNDHVVIRTATNEVRTIRYCTPFDIDISGVLAHVCAYVIDIPQSYSLLLGRRWLYQVRAFGDYANGTYTIYNAEGRPHVVQATSGPINDSPEVMLNPQKEEGTETELSDWDKQGIKLERSKMQAIITHLVEDAKVQSKDWINPGWEDGGEESESKLEEAEEYEEGTDSEGEYFLSEEEYEDEGSFPAGNIPKKVHQQ